MLFLNQKISFLLQSDMNTLGDRIKQLRKKINMSQSELAQKVGLSYAQIGRYETKGSQPPAEALKKIAEELGVTPDYLISGSIDEKALVALADTELLHQFRIVETMNDDDKHVIKKLIDAFITKKQIQQLAL